MAADAGAPAPDRRRTRVVVILLGLTSVALAALAIALLRDSSSSPGAGDDLFGIAKGAPLDSADLDKMVETGVRSVRFVVSWPAVQPHEGSFNWGSTDQLVGGLASRGIRPVPSVFGSPAWTSPNPVRPPIDSVKARTAWQDFLKAAVERYGPGGEYWTDAYPQRFGEDANQLPIESWQIWNEPNLPHYFAPRSSAPEYTRLLELSHDAITAQDPGAQIVLAGMPGYGKPDTAWEFLDRIYDQPGVKSDFDVVALHPYARTVGQLEQEIEKLRSAMAKHGEGQTPLWLTEVGWGSAPPDRLGLNKGLSGQERMLSGSFELILDHRESWHVERLFWFDWRDPPKGTPQACSFCSSAGLLERNGEPKPAWSAYKSFATG
jgi:polysaccharide biosynthesis protein PslG